VTEAATTTAAPGPYGPVFEWPVRVYFEDTDAGGVVYHANYLRFFERARTEWLRAQGWSQERLRTEAQIVFLVANMNLHFKRPARLDDQLLATVEITERKRFSATIAQTLISAEDRSQLIVKAEVQVACVSLVNFRPHLIPDTVIAGARTAA